MTEAQTFTGKEAQASTLELDMLRNNYPEFSRMYQLLSNRIVDAESIDDAEISVVEARELRRFIFLQQRKTFYNQEALKFKDQQLAEAKQKAIQIKSSVEALINLL